MSVWTLNETLKQVGTDAQTGSEAGFISNGESFTGMVYIKSGSILRYYTSNGFIVVYENQTWIHPEYKIVNFNEGFPSAFSTWLNANATLVIFLSRSTNLDGSVTQSAQTQTYTFSTANKFVDKNISLKVKVADDNYIAVVTSIPTTKATNLIYNSTNGKFYVWEE